MSTFSGLEFSMNARSVSGAVATCRALGGATTKLPRVNDYSLLSAASATMRFMDELDNSACATTSRRQTLVTLNNTNGMFAGREDIHSAFEDTRASRMSIIAREDLARDVTRPTSSPALGKG